VTFVTALDRAWLRIGQQLRKPVGLGGSLSAQIMELLNEESNRIAIAALNVTANDTVLELGFGSGRAIETISNLAPEGQVFGIDQSSTMYDKAKRRNRHGIRKGRVHLVQGRFDALPWKQGVIDKCLATHVAYFMAADEVCEARRVLRPGGILSMLVTDRTAMERWKFAHPSTHQLFAADDLAKLLGDGGFPPNQVDVRSVSLGMFVPGLLALATKS
jgi:ubiquinone/menaquinone biosynthesis C-methylase UbiE